MNESPRLSRIRGGCDGDDCPALYQTDRGTYVVQGDLIDFVTTPDGEAAVEVPASMLRGL